MTPFEFRSPKDNGSHPRPPVSWSNTPAPAPLPPSATFVRIQVTMDFSAPCIAAPLVKKPPLVTLPIIVWRPNVISVVGGDTQMRYATSESVEDATTRATWSITALTTRLTSQTLDQLMGGPTRMTTISTPLWTTTRGMEYIEPGARLYEGGNVTISYLYHVFFLISVVRRPYFSFAPSHIVTDLYLLAFPDYSLPLLFSL